jgi:protein arginine N-methyltransferase 1
MGALGFHVGRLNDAVRTSAFDRALREVVRPGDVVADLGAGSGILGLLALRHGARRVYAVERHPVAELARMIARENGLEDRLVVLRGEAAEVRLPERADVVVSETLGNAVFDEGILELLRDARRRHLKPGGRLVPSRIRVLAAPATTPESPGPWRYGLRMDALRSLAQHASWSPDKVALRGTPRVLGEAVPGRDRLPLEWRGRWRTAGAGGLLVWFDARLSPSVRLSSRRAGSWKPAFFPARERLRGAFSARLRFETAEETTWQFDGQAAQNSTLGDVYLAALRSLGEDAVPRLPAPRARRARVLAGIDGRRTVRELARSLRGTPYAEALSLVKSVCMDESAIW